MVAPTLRNVIRRMQGCPGGRPRVRKCGSVCVGEGLVPSRNLAGRYKTGPYVVYVTLVYVEADLSRDSNPDGPKRRKMPRLFSRGIAIIQGVSP